MIKPQTKQHQPKGGKEKNMMNTNFFADARTLEDVKQIYKKLARELHPDCNPDRDTTADFQRMQQEYNEAFNRLKNVHVNKDGETYEKETAETPEEYAGIINALLKMQGLMIELCGSWLWVSGNTKQYHEEIKALGFKWSKNKGSWYFHFEPYRKHSKKTCTMDQIRNMYGSQRFSEKTTSRFAELETATA